MPQQIYIKITKLINQNDNSLHKVFLKGFKDFSDMNTNIWKNMESSAWRDANIYEKLFKFCFSF